MEVNQQHLPSPPWKDGWIHDKLSGNSFLLGSSSLTSLGGAYLS
jgi:hypothetical protein